MKDKDKFVVAVKDVSLPGQIRPGKVLGKYREREFAKRAQWSLAKRENRNIWQVGVFRNGKLLS